MAVIYVVSPHRESTRAAKRDPAIVSVVREKAVRRCVIAALGDSLTSGFGDTVDAPYTAFLESDLKTAGYDCRVVNDGVPGETAKEAVERVRDVIKQRPTAAIVEVGGNDGLQVRDVSAIQRDLDTIIGKLCEARITVLVAALKLPSQYDPGYARAFSQIYATVALRHRAILVELLDGIDEHSVQRDGIHPTIEGNRRIAANIDEVLLTALSGHATCRVAVSGSSLANTSSTKH